MPVPEDPGHLRREGRRGRGSQGLPECSEGLGPHQVDSGRAHTAPEAQGLVAGRGFLKAVVKLRTERQSEAGMQLCGMWMRRARLGLVYV